MTDVASSEAPARASQREVLSGVEALVRLFAVRQQLDDDAGLRTAAMVSGYPGSPLAGFDATLDKVRAGLPDLRVEHRPGLNEELAAATVWGSQMGAVIDYRDVDGVVGAWYGKGPGLDRSGDALKHANAMGAGPNGGAVVFCGDDPASKSSTLACDSQYTFEDAAIPVLYPGDQQDCFDLGLHAFRMSRYAGAWVGMKVVTAVADGIGPVSLSPERLSFTAPSLDIDGNPWQHRPLATIGPHAVPDQEELVLERRLRAAQAYALANGLDRVCGAAPGARLGVVVAGKTYFDVMQALSDLGIGADELAGAGIRILRLAMTYPLVEKTALDFADSVERILVVEEKRGFVETQLRSLLHESGRTTPVVGKRDTDGARLVTSTGELTPDPVGDVLVRVLPDLKIRQDAKADARSGIRNLLPLVPATPARAPGFCSGCPHNRSTVAPDGALVGGGVGCHGIMYFEARQTATKKLPPTPMGAEGVPWIGLAPFVDEPHVIQNLGDGTLSHSGSLAIRASVAAGTNITFKILYNVAVAMTGGQDVVGLMDVPSMTRALHAEGVKRVVVCAEEPKRYGRRAKWAPGVQVYGRDRLDEVQKELRAVAGTTVLIYDQRCAAESRRLRKRGELPEPPQRVVINEAVCEGCGDCGTKSNCLSVLPHGTEFGEKRRIHDPSCNRDFTCLEGDCPSFVTITPSKRGTSKPAAARTQPSLPAGELPEPAPAAHDGRYGVYFTGIGGTGVVSAGRIVAGAAEAAGLLVDGLDQTGLSQKAGAVVSQLHLTRPDSSAQGSVSVGAGGADLYLSGDILQAASAVHLARIHPGTTLAVVDDQVQPTAAMLQSDLHGPGVPQLRATIAEAAGQDRTLFLDTRRIAEEVFSDHLLANVVLLGAAFQRGGLPFTSSDVDRAMGRFGRKGGAANRQAFAWGRWAVHDPAAVESALAAAEAGQGGITDPSATAQAAAGALVRARVRDLPELPTDLSALITRRTAQVVDYQNGRLAGRYLDLVVTTAGRDSASRGWELTRAVAESWFKLLTYKDEYEVARLHLKADHARSAAELGITGPYTVKYHLHPPTLRRMGLAPKKIPMGLSYDLAFRGLRRLKGLRGTPFDVFGYDPDRRLERALIGEYAELLSRSQGLDYEQQVAVAASAQEIKGYAGIKEAAVERWREHVATLLHASPVAETA